MAETTQMKLSQILENGDASTTTINHINPNASNAVLREFAHKLNELTTSTYNSATKVVTTDIDTEGDTRPVPTISLTINNVAVTSLSEDDFVNKKTGNLQTNSDGVMYYYLKGTRNLFFNLIYGSSSTSSGMAELTANAPRLVPGTLVLGVLATDNYQAREIEIPVTAS